MKLWATLLANSKSPARAGDWRFYQRPNTTLRQWTDFEYPGRARAAGLGTWPLGRERLGSKGTPAARHPNLASTGSQHVWGKHARSPLRDPLMCAMPLAGPGGREGRGLNLAPFLGLPIGSLLPPGPPVDGWRYDRDVAECRSEGGVDVWPGTLERRKRTARQGRV